MKTKDEIIKESRKRYPATKPMNYFYEGKRAGFVAGAEWMKSPLGEVIKDELTNFLDFLLKEGYCDSDVYSESPSAIDRYMHPNLNR